MMKYELYRRMKNVMGIGQDKDIEIIWQHYYVETDLIQKVNESDVVIEW